MKRYTILTTKECIKVITVDAESVDEALDKAKQIAVDSKLDDLVMPNSFKFDGDFRFYVLGGKENEHS